MAWNDHSATRKIRPARNAIKFLQRKRARSVTKEGPNTAKNNKGKLPRENKSRCTNNVSKFFGSNYGLWDRFRMYFFSNFFGFFGSTNIQILFELLKQPKENNGSTKIRIETFSQGFSKFSHFLEFLKFHECSKSSCFAEAAKGKQRSPHFCKACGKGFG